MDDSGHRVLIEPGEDAVRTYTDEEEERIARNLLAVTREVHAGDWRGRRSDERLAAGLHQRMFEGVRDHAGRFRGPDRGTENLVFGPQRAVARDLVAGELAALFKTLRRSIDSFDRNQDADDYEAGAIHVAVWAHAELIRIHPFEDGNGRTGRLLANAILVRPGLRPVAVEACREEYLAVLNHYYVAKEIEPLRDLYLRLAVEQLPGD